MTGERLTPQRTEYRRIVVKVGSNVLTGGTDALDVAAMAHIAEQIASLEERGVGVVMVTSGAVAAGRHRLRTHREARSFAASVESRQALAAVGQSRLMAVWDGLFEQHATPIAQALLTRRDLADRMGYLNARNTLLNLLDLRVVPIVNENDVVSTDEIKDTKIGDNDNLSAQVANLIDADLLLILTDIAGLYTADPARDRDARLIEVVERIDAEIERAAGGNTGSSRGIGGMTTKVQAARIATAAGAHVVLAEGRARDIVLRAVAGEPVGTHFLPTGDRTESRRRYLLSGLQARGRVTVDGGAAQAILAGGKSLLPAGIVACEGDFQRGDVIRICTGDGAHLASGTSNYSAEEVRSIQGKHSDQIAGVLGYDYGAEVVHRNNLVLV